MFNETSVSIFFQVQTRGYIGLGFSPSGGMKGADIIIGWIDEGGKPYISVRLSTGELRNI